MSVVYRNHNGFSIKRRLLVTLLCLTLATTLVASVTIYVDSASVKEWEDEIKFSKVSMMATGVGIENYITDISQIAGVNNVSNLETSHASIGRTNVIYEFHLSGNVYTLTDEFMSKFPNVFTLTEGRWPQNESEIALSDDIIRQIFLSSGWTVEYGFSQNTAFANLTIVGTYTQSAEDIYSHYYLSAMGVVVKDLLNENNTITRTYINIDHSPINPFNANEGLSYISAISEKIKKLDPKYPEVALYSSFTIYDYISGGIREYLEWRDSVRENQIMRASGVIMIVLLLVIMGIQYNLENQMHTISFYRARGATPNRINLRIIREILLVACLSSLLGSLLAIFLSRFALASTGYLVLDISAFFSSPLLITSDSLILIFIASISLPLVTYLGIKISESGKSRIIEGSGKLGKISKTVAIIKWDFGILVISLIMLFAFYTSGASIQQNIIFSLVSPFLPVPIYIAVGSLVIKGLERGTMAFSRISSKFLGKIPASIGVRQIGKQAKSAGLVIMVLVLTVTLAWNNAITDVTLPQTRENHAKFALGGDIVFHLKKNSEIGWDEFVQNATETQGVVATSIVSIKRMYLSTGSSGSVNFIIINPTEYSQIGYSKFGDRLNQTDFNSVLTQLADNPTGAIITQDIAEEYQLSKGDMFKVFKTKEDVDYFTFTILDIVDSLTQPLIPASTYIPTSAGYSVGLRKIWINQAYVSEKLDIIVDTYSYLTIATETDYNDTKIALNLLSTGGKYVVQTNDWDAVDLELDKLVFTTAYQMDRSVDTMLTITSAILAVGVIIVYMINDVKNRSREIAVLRAIGMETRSIVRIHIAEFLFLVVLSLILLLGYSPIFIANSLITSLSSYTSWQFKFPIPIFPIIPILTLITILSVFLIGLFIFTSLVIPIGLKANLSESLDSYWTVSGPMVEEEI